MANIEAGALDRRIMVIQAARTRDASGDVLFDWANPEREFPRWAGKTDAAGREIKSAQQVIRDVDTTWTLRWDSESRAIAPECFRFVWRGTVYEIVSVSEGPGRFDRINFLCASRPDLEGARGRDNPDQP